MGANNTQTNTKTGRIFVDTAADLTGKEGYVAKLANNSGKLVAALPAAVTDAAAFIIDEVISPTKVALLPLNPDRNSRAILSGTAAPGDLISFAVGGLIIKLPTASGSYRVIGIAEETGAATQWLRFRPFGQYIQVVP